MPLNTLEHLRLHHRTAILQLAEKHGMSNVKIFGSVARGDDGPNSDIDFLVSPLHGRGLGDRCSFWNDLEDLLHKKVDVINERTLFWFIRPAILAEAKPL
jgi:uncharacterized protein